MVDVYHPKTLEEALQFRSSTGAVPFSGGTDIMVRYRTSHGVLPDLPWPIVLLGHLKELQYLRLRKGSLCIGAETTLTDVMDHELTPPLLKQAIGLMAAPALRNLGTLAGNIGNASPAGDAVCALIALDASIELASPRGRRVVSLDLFIVGPGRTILAEDELITEIIVPIGEGHISWYKKVGTRRANALSKLSVSADWAVDDNVLTHVRIALGAVAPVVLRCRDIEDDMTGMKLPEIALQREDLMNRYKCSITPIDDQRSSAAYRKQAASNLVGAVLDEMTGGR